MPDHTVIFGAGAQTLYHCPHNRSGIPTVASSPTYRIVDLREGETSTQYEVVASTAAGIDASSQATSSVSGAGQSDARRIAVSNASLYTQGRTFLMRGADQQREAVTIDRIDTVNQYVYALRPLRGTYPSGSTLRSVELQAIFPALEANDDSETVDDGGGPYAVEWTYSLHGETWKRLETVFVRRNSVTPWVTVDDVFRINPSVQRRIDRQTAHDAVFYATEEVMAHLESQGFVPQNYRSGYSGKLAVRLIALEHMLHTFDGEQDDEFAKMYRERADALLHNMTHGRAPTDTVVTAESELVSVPEESMRLPKFKTG